MLIYYTAGDWDIWLALYVKYFYVYVFYEIYQERDEYLRI